jgi:O-antigen/teichoic acid export membrane protein
LRNWKSISNLRDFFTKGHERSIAAKKNIAISFIIKGGSVLMLLVTVPMTIDYVNTKQYGIWITLSSIIGWFSFFDIGFGNGLKNKLAESIARGQDQLARIYISTTYLILALIAIALLAAFVLVNNFLDWSRILNVSPFFAEELSLVSLILFTIFCFQFVLQLLVTVCVANQNAMMATLIGFFGNLIGLSLVFALTKFTTGSLFYLCLSIGLGPLISLVVFSFVLYGKTYKKYSPSFKLADLSYGGRLMHLGVRFFFIQLGFIFFYNANNVIISRTIGPEVVTAYSVAFQYFSVITMISGIIMTPFWPAFTEADAKQDYEWIKQTVSKLEKLCAGIFLLSMAMLVVSPWVYSFWLGKKIDIPFSLSAVFSFYVALNTLRTVYCYYMNGVGKIKLQIYMLIICAFINIPLAIFLGKMFGITGVILSTTILSFFCCIIEFTQYRKLINGKALGIWNA